MSKDIFDDLFDNVLEYRLMSLILRNVVYKEEGTMIEGIHVKRGQWIRSYRKLAEDLKYKQGRGYKRYSPPAVLKAMKRLEEKGYIKIRMIQLTDKLTDRFTDKLTLIEVVETKENQEVRGDDKNIKLTDRFTDQLTDEETKIKKDKEIKKEPTLQEKFGKKNLSTDADVESFVEFLSDFNPFDKIPKKMLVKYINTIRFRRKTKRIATSIVADLLMKEWKQFAQEVVMYALWTHIENHSKDKDENYTLGIMRNTDVHEARRKLIILKNKNQSPQQTSTKKMSYWEQKQRQEDELERKRLEQRDRQIKVQQFIDAGFHPMNDADLLEEWLEGRISLADLKERKWGS